MQVDGLCGSLSVDCFYEGEDMLVTLELLDHPNKRQLPKLMCVVDPIADDERVGYGEADEIRIDRHFATTWLVDKRTGEDSRCLLPAEQIARVKKRPPRIHDVVPAPGMLLKCDLGEASEFA